MLNKNDLFQKMRTKSQKTSAIIGLIVISLILFLSIWQGIVYFFDMPRFILPAPYDVVIAFKQHWQLIFENGLITASEIILGLLLGAMLGVFTARRRCDPAKAPIR